jgi:hypothetical protein
VLIEAAERFTPGFWYVAPCDAPFRQVDQVERDVRDLRNELIGEPIGSEWRPPPYKLRGSRTWPAWMNFHVPLLSDSGLVAIGHLLETHCEVLPWIDEPRHRYSLINVLTRVPRKHWSCERSSSYNGVLASADIISVHGPEIPPIFTLEGFGGRVYVSDRVARRSVEMDLSGAVFVDPRIVAIHVPFIQGRMKIKRTGFIRLDDDF